MAGTYRRRQARQVKAESDSDHGIEVFKAKDVLLVNTTDDIQKNRHKKDPFGDKYLRLLQMPLEEEAQEAVETKVAQAKIESATTNVHVRIELIRAMKQALMKQTAEAVKQCQTTTPPNGKKAHAVRSSRKKTNTVNGFEASEAAEGSRGFFDEAAFQMYQTLKEGKNLSFNEEVIKRINDGNPNFRDDSVLSFKDAELLPACTLDQLIARLFPHGSPLHVDLGALNREAEASRYDCKLVKQLFDECAQPMALSQDSQEDSQQDNTMQEPVMLPAYLGTNINTQHGRDKIRFAPMLDDECKAAADIEEGCTSPGEAATHKGEMDHTAHTHTEAAQEFPKELHIVGGDWLDMQCEEEQTDTDHEQPLHARQDNEALPGSSEFSADQRKQQDPMLITHHDEGGGDNHEDAKTSEIQGDARGGFDTPEMVPPESHHVKHLPQLKRRRRVYLIRDDDPEEAGNAVGGDEIEEQITAPQCMPALTKHAPKVPQLGRANCLPLSKQLPCQQQPDVCEEQRGREDDTGANTNQEKSNKNLSGEYDEEGSDLSIVEEDDKILDAGSHIVLQPNFSLENLNQLHPDVLFRLPRGKAAYKPVHDPEMLLLPVPQSYHYSSEGTEEIAADEGHLLELLCAAQYDSIPATIGRQATHESSQVRGACPEENPDGQPQPLTAMEVMQRQQAQGSSRQMRMDDVAGGEPDQQCQAAISVHHPKGAQDDEARRALYGVFADCSDSDDSLFEDMGLLDLQVEQEQNRPFTEVGGNHAFAQLAGWAEKRVTVDQQQAKDPLKTSQPEILLPDDDEEGMVLQPWQPGSDALHDRYRQGRASAGASLGGALPADSQLRLDSAAAKEACMAATATIPAEGDADAGNGQRGGSRPKDCVSFDLLDDFDVVQQGSLAAVPGTEVGVQPAEGVLTADVAKDKSEHPAAAETRSEEMDWLAGADMAGGIIMDVDLEEHVSPETDDPQRMSSKAGADQARSLMHDAMRSLSAEDARRQANEQDASAVISHLPAHGLQSAADGFLFRTKNQGLDPSAAEARTEDQPLWGVGCQGVVFADDSESEEPYAADLEQALLQEGGLHSNLADADQQGHSDAAQPDNIAVPDKGEGQSALAQGDAQEMDMIDRLLGSSLLGREGDDWGILFADDDLDFKEQGPSYCDDIVTAKKTVYQGEAPAKVAAARRLSRKRAREELRDQMIKALLEDKGESRALQPIVDHMAKQLHQCNIQDSGSASASLSQLAHGCKGAKVEGAAEACTQRFLFALLTLVQRNNIGAQGGCLNPQLKLMATSDSHDVCIAAAPA